MLTLGCGRLCHTIIPRIRGLILAPSQKRRRYHPQERQNMPKARRYECPPAASAPPLLASEACSGSR